MIGKDCSRILPLQTPSLSSYFSVHSIQLSGPSATQPLHALSQSIQ